MNQLIDIFSRMAPVLIMLVIGFLFKKFKIFPLETIKGIKNVVFLITLPVVLFGAFYKVKYDFTVFIFFATVFLCCTLALVLGFVIKKVLKLKWQMFPFLMTGFEAGMLGYALYSIAYGAENVSKFATADLGQVVFVYTVVMTTLYTQNSGKEGIKKALKSMSVTPAFWGVFGGIIVGITGLGLVLNSSVFGPAISNSLSFIGAPTGALILLIVGYELEFSAVNVRAALITISSRLLIMLPLSFIAWAVINAITGNTDTLLRSALMVLFILPAPFVIPLFVDSNDEKEYIATTLSVNTLISMFFFIVIMAVL